MKINMMQNVHYINEVSQLYGKPLHAIRASYTTKRPQGTNSS